MFGIGGRDVDLALSVVGFGIDNPLCPRSSSRSLAFDH